jgi:hypothetical protein
MKIKQLANPAINILLVFVMVFTQSWSADGLAGNKLFPRLWGGVQCETTCPTPFWVVEAALLFVSLACAFGLYFRRSTFLPINVQRIGEPGIVEPRQVLILTVSNNPWKFQWNEKLKNKLTVSINGNPPIPLPDKYRLDDALDVMKNLANSEAKRPFFSWEQLLRAIAPHHSKLERIILVGSTNGANSYSQLDDCKKLIQHYFDLTKIEISKESVHFDSLDNLLSRYNGIIAKEKSRKSQLIFDVTGGTKVVSIAVAMVTLEHPEIEFQYVETEGEKRVRTFNVTTSALENQ